MSKLEEMSIFMKVIEHGSFSKAADILGVSPPTITRAINNLENKLGSRLLLRSTRNVQATEAAEQYYNDCKAIIDAIREAEEKIKSDKNDISGKLTITAPENFGQNFLVQLIGEFSEIYSDIRINTIFTDKHLNLVSDKINIAVRLGELEDSFYVMTRIGMSKIDLCASPEYFKMNGLPQNPSELSSRKIISTSDFNDNGIILGFPHYKTSIRLTPSISFNTERFVLDAAISGYGIAILMYHDVYEHIKLDQLQIIFPDVQTNIIPISILHSEGNKITKRTRLLYDFLVDRLRSNPALSLKA